MPFIDRIPALLDTLTPAQITLGLAVVSALMLVVEERRLALLPLLAQYILIALMVGPRIYRPILFVRAGIGIAICLVLFITARHVQRGLRVLVPAARDESPIWRTPPAPALRAISLASMGPFFRLIVTILGGFVAYGLWRTYPIEGIPVELNLTGYWLMSIGLLMTLTSAEPLRMGLGLLTFVNGFEAVYLFLEQSFVVIGLLGIIDMVVALGIAACAENWLDSLQEETAP